MSKYAWSLSWPACIPRYGAWLLCVALPNLTDRKRRTLSTHFTNSVTRIFVSFVDSGLELRRETYSALSSSKVVLLSWSMDSDEENRPLPNEPNGATAVPDLYEVFSTPYTKEDVARGVFNPCPTFFVTRFLPCWQKTCDEFMDARVTTSKKPQFKRWAELCSNFYIFWLANRRGFQCTKECNFWTLYAKVLRVQCFLSRWPKTNTSSCVTDLHILKINMYSYCNILGCRIWVSLP